MSFEEIFNPGAEHRRDYRNQEKILPAPAPVAGAKPLVTDDGESIVIPSIDDLDD